MNTSGDREMNQDIVETRTARLWLGNDGILRGVVKPYAEEKLEDAQANVKAAQKIAAGRRMPLLIDMRQMKSASREARQWYAGQEPVKHSLDQALLIGSPIGRMIGNFFLSSSKPAFPTKLFSSEVDALNWLRGFIK